MARQPSRGVQGAVGDLYTWWQSETPEYRELVMAILAALPGGDKAEDAGFEPIENVGWKEAAMLGRLLVALRDSGDVAYAVRKLLRA